MDSEELIRIENLTKAYHVGDITVQALRGVSLSIAKGSFVAIMGPSGSGKSTLLNLLGCLDRPTAGTYHLGTDDVSQMDDDELSEVRGRKIGFIFQSYNLIHQLSVIENVQMPLFYQGLDSPKNNRRCEHFAGLFGLADRLDHRPNQLSGGQQQRVAVARAVAGEPSLLLADEPTGNLDSANGDAVMDLLQELHRDGATVCLVTHSPHYARYADKVVHLFDGRISQQEERG
jgi:putative ABC transport system ATP-binding protein